MAKSVAQSPGAGRERETRSSPWRSLRRRDKPSRQTIGSIVTEPVYLTPAEVGAILQCIPHYYFVWRNRRHDAGDQVRNQAGEVEKAASN